jgi:UDP-N-acetylglucosamine 2-epimerase (non-hydrolysing)
VIVVRAKILCVAGARPNFIKIAPVVRALGAHPRLEPRLVHTGQHYDEKLSRVFFEELGIPRPDVELAVGSGSHAAQTAEIMRRFEPVVESEQPHGVLVVGDVNSTIACALVAAKYTLREGFRCALGERTRPLVIHVEAGLRSFDADMPEELNRRLTDAISDVLFASEPDGVKNLRAEGVAEERIHFVGNVMIDTLLAARDRAAATTVLADLGLEEKAYGLVTLHRPANVDDSRALGGLVSALDEIARSLPLLFPVHPRTRARLADASFELDPARWRVIEPLGYLEFLRLTAAARVVLTDSGGIQEETTVLGVPCVTLRENTERPVTIGQGTNHLGGTTRTSILAAYAEAVRPRESRPVPALWDGRAAVRIADVLDAVFSGAAAAADGISAGAGR